MAELKELLERGLDRFEPSADRGLDRTFRRVRRRQRNRRVTAGVVAVVVFAGTVTGIWASLKAGNRTVPTAPQPSITATVEIPGRTTDVAVGPEGVWVATREGAVQIDPATASVISTVNLGVDFDHRIAVGGGFVWLANLSGDLPMAFSDSVTVINPARAQTPNYRGDYSIGGAVDRSTPGWLTDLVADGSSVWLLARPRVEDDDRLGGEVLRLDQTDGHVIWRIFIPTEGSDFRAQHIAYGAGSIWVSSEVLHPDQPHLAKITGIDPATGALRPSVFALNGTGDYIAADGSTVWIAVQYGPGQAIVAGFDPVSTKPVAGPLTLPMTVTDISASDSGVWVTSSDRRVWRIDPGTGKLTGQPLQIGSVAQAVAADDTGAWVVGSGVAYRIELCPASGCRQPRPIPTQSPSSLAAQDMVIRETTRDDPSCPPIGMVSGKELLTARPGDCVLQLAAEASGTLYGWIAPVAIDSMDQSELVAYNTWTSSGGNRLGGMTSIRVRSLQGADDSVFRDEAASFAWKPTGWQFAYFKITGESEGGLPIGQVFVGASPSRNRVPGPIPPTERWTTTAARWIVAAWAQDWLLVYEELEGEALRLYVLDGPGQIRQLGPADTDASLVAVSPDGSQAFVSLGEGGDIVALYDLATGEELARLDMTELIDPKTGLSYGVFNAGSWAGSVVAAAGGPGLMMFDVTDGAIELKRVLRLPDGINEPQLVGGVDRVVGWQYLMIADQDRYRWLDCDLKAAACEAGPPSETPLYVVYNPSRPEAG